MKVIAFNESSRKQGYYRFSDGRAGSVIISRKQSCCAPATGTLSIPYKKRCHPENRADALRFMRAQHRDCTQEDAGYICKRKFPLERAKISYDYDRITSI